MALEFASRCLLCVFLASAREDDCVQRALDSAALTLPAVDARR